MTSSRPFPDPQDLAGHARFVRSLAQALVRDAATADDLAQDTLLAAVVHRGPPPRSLRAWLAGVLRNKLRMRLRGDARRAGHEADVRSRGSASADPAQEAVRRDLLLHLAQAVRELPEPYLATVFLRYYDDLPVADIARRHEVPEATVHTRLRRAVERLRVAMDARTGGDRDGWIALLAVADTPHDAPAPMSSGGSCAAGSRIGSSARSSSAVGLAVVAVAAALALLVAVAGVWRTGDDDSQAAESGGTAAATAEVRDAGTARSRSAAPETPHDAAPAGRGDADSAPLTLVSGVVLDAVTGRPVAEATVETTYLGRTQTVPTDGEGVWRAAVPRTDAADPNEAARFGRTVRIVARAAGRIPGETQFSLQPLPARATSGAPVAAPIVVLERAIAQVSGRVLDSRGLPVPEATVEMHSPCASNPWGTRLERLTADADGRFGPVAVAAGVVRAEAWSATLACGAASVLVAPSASGAVTLDIVLPVTVPLRGVVTGVDGTPVPGVIVKGRPARTRAATGRDGRFALPLAATERVELDVECDGWRLDSRERSAAAGDDVVLTVHRTGGVAGRVVLRDGSPPPERLRVWAQPEGSRDGRDAWTDDDGRFRIGALLPLVHELRAGDAVLGYASASVRIVSGAEHGGVELCLRGDVRAQGRVVDAMSRLPIAGAGVSSWVVAADSADASGRFPLHIPPDAKGDEHAVRVRAVADGYAETTRNVTLGRNGDVGSFEIALEPIVAVPVTVIDADGRPVAGARIRRSRDWDAGDDSTDMRGRAMVGVAPSAPQRVVSHPLAGEWTGAVHCSAAGEFVVRLGAAPALRVQVLDPAGAPLATAFALVRECAVPADEEGWVAVPADASANFTAPGYETRTVDVRREASAGRPPAPVTLRRIGEFIGRVRDAAGRPVAGVQVSLDDGSASADVLSDGAGGFRIGLPVGATSRLRIVSPRDVVESSAWAVAGGPPREIRLPPTGRVRVVGLAGREAPDAEGWQLDARDPVDRTPIGCSFRWRRAGDAWVADAPAGRLRLALQTGTGADGSEEWAHFAPVVVPPGGEATVALPATAPRGRLSGAVQTPGGGAIPGARVVDALRGEVLGETDHIGAIVVRPDALVPAIRADLVVEADGFAPAEVPEFDLSSDAPLMVRLVPANRVHGRVTGLATDASDVRLRRVAASGRASEWIGVRPDGTFSFEEDGLAAGPATLELLVPGRLPFLRTVVLEAEREIVVSAE